MSGESQVSGSNINANYPIPGQNNSSQGFRDNFAAIKVALNRTAVELTQLRQNAVFKNPVDGLSAQGNDYSYGKIVRPQLLSYTETIVDLGQQSGSVYIDFNRGNFQKLTVYTDVGPSFRNIPAGNQSAIIKIWFNVMNPGATCSLPESTIYGTNTSFIKSGKITFPARGDYLLVLQSVDNGKKFFVYSLSGLTDFRFLPSSASSSGTVSSTTGGSLTDLDLTQIPIASVSDFGIVKVDGTTVGIFDGVLSVIGGVPAVSSDARLKSNVETITSALDLNRRLRGVHFNYLAHNEPSMGVLAQEVEPVLPSIVKTTDDGYKMVNYYALSGLFIECIKSLEEKISKLEQEIQELKNRNS